MTKNEEEEEEENDNDEDDEEMTGGHLFTFYYVWRIANTFCSVVSIHDVHGLCFYKSTAAAAAAAAT